MKKMKVNTKAVIFDMDGVITHSMPDHYRAWKKIFLENGINVSRINVYKREGEPGIKSIIEIFQAHQIPITRSRAKVILSKKERVFKSNTKQRFVVGARSFVRMLHRENFKLALVTGTSRHELHRILPDYLFKLFDVTITGNDVRHGKPHPEPYIKALRKLRIKPRNAIVIENAPFGIRSAKGANLKCFAIRTSLPKVYLQGADAIFTSIRDMKNKVNFCKNEN